MIPGLPGSNRASAQMHGAMQNFKDIPATAPSSNQLAAEKSFDLQHQPVLSKVVAPGKEFRTHDAEEAKFRNALLQEGIIASKNCESQFSAIMACFDSLLHDERERSSTLEERLRQLERELDLANSKVLGERKHAYMLEDRVRQLDNELNQATSEHRRSLAEFGEERERMREQYDRMVEAHRVLQDTVALGDKKALSAIRQLEKRAMTAEEAVAQKDISLDMLRSEVDRLRAQNGHPPYQPRVKSLPGDRWSTNRKEPAETHLTPRHVRISRASTFSTGQVSNCSACQCGLQHGQSESEPLHRVGRSVSHRQRPASASSARR